MEELKAHPNTQALLAAWRRLSDGQAEGGGGPAATDYPGLVGHLFVVTRVSEGDYSFRRVGYALEKLFGRQLADHNFLSLWNNPDRQLVAAAMAAARADRGPVLVTARGESLDGKRVELEFCLAPLVFEETEATRFLGLCQSITPAEILCGRPLRRLQALAVYPPAPEPEPIRIVSSR